MLYVGVALIVTLTTLLYLTEMNEKVFITINMHSVQVPPTQRIKTLKI